MKHDFKVLISKISKIKFIYLGFIFAFIFSACKNKTEEFSARGAEFFGYTRAQTREFIMDSSAYDWTTKKLTKYHFLIRELALDTFTDLSGHVALRIEQYISRDTGITYKFYKLSTVFTDHYGCQKVENNQRIVKLVLPITEKRWWDGNIYNNLGWQKYWYSSVGKPYSTAYYSPNDCVVVSQRDDSTIISRDKQFEVYAKNIGLIYRYDKSIQYISGQPQGSIIEFNLKRLR